MFLHEMKRDVDDLMVVDNSGLDMHRKLMAQMLVAAKHFEISHRCILSSLSAEQIVALANGTIDW